MTLDYFEGATWRDIEARMTGHAYTQVEYQLVKAALGVSFLQFIIIVKHIHPQA